MAKFYTTNPTTEERLAEYDTVSTGQLRDILVKSRSAQRAWASLSVKDRISYFPKLISALEQLKEKIATLVTQEVGKPLGEAIAEIERCEIPLKYFSENGEKLLIDEVVTTQAQKSYIHFEPIGLVGIFTPWNYPFWGIFRQLAPALLCGNGLLVKPSLKTAGSALAVLDVVKQAGLPDNLVSIVMGGEEITESFISGVETVIAITSPRLGRVVAEIAGRNMKRINLQLSGSDAFVVLEDCDVQYVARRAAESRLINAGQDCVSAKRFIVRQEVYEKFIKNFVEEMRKITPINPLSPKAKMGPLGDKKLLEILESQIEDATSNSAKVLLGGKRIQGRGYFFPPTIVGGVKPNMKVWQEETFGPVAAVMSVANDEEAVSMANHSSFGLGASIWTKNVKRGEALGLRLEAGVVTINEQPKSNPAMPYGGLKQTGMGRDFSKYGLLHFLNTKSVLVFDK